MKRIKKSIVLLGVTLLLAMASGFAQNAPSIDMVRIPGKRTTRSAGPR